LSTNISAAIHQPHYFPWIPYINKLASVDIFIIFDTVQLPMGKSKVLRTKYIDHGMERWLSIPFGKKGSLVPIKDVKLGDLMWKKTHVDKLMNAYGKSLHARWAMDLVHDCLWSGKSYFLVDIEHDILEKLCLALNIKTRLVRASELIKYEKMSLQKYIVSLLDVVGADTYLSGTNTGSLKSIDESLFRSKGKKIIYQDYMIPHYRHLNTTKEFTPTVSILDTLFTCGPVARYHVYRAKT
jgi:hypothetical protein|tara:strand:+ start:149 stop:868 length:720 start_codon:yes stop_codon:yes gene_type:complete